MNKKWFLFIAINWRHLPAHEDGNKRDDGRRDPHVEQHDGDDALGHVDRVLEWLDDGVVAVNRNAAQVEDGRRREEDVQRIPHVAHEVAKIPAASHLHAGVESHRQDSHQQVGKR